MQNLLMLSLKKTLETKKILGVSAGFHDAALTVLHGSEIVFAAHSERYSKKKNDMNVCEALQRAALEYGPFDEIVYYEKPWKRQLRKLRSGEPWGGNWLLESELQKTIPLIMDTHLVHDWQNRIGDASIYKPISSVGHHLAHAAAGFQTSPFNEAAVVVIDAIGEMDTISIYKADYGTTPSYMGSNQRKKARYKRVYRQTYPHSIGMFYSAVTKRVGLRPMDEEYITMGMAAYGTGSKAIGTLVDNLVYDIPTATFSRNMHVGIDDLEFPSDVDEMDIAAAGQQLCEELITGVMRTARELTGSHNLVYMGGVALNCVANSQLGDIFDRVWIMPNPGDAGSSLGAAALAYGSKLNWTTPFLGTNIGGEYPVKELIKQLKTKKIVGVASGRAEFGPRALGNRSLLADPRGKKIKDQVNEIKRRQKFRPFAPVILEEHVHDYFDMPKNQPTSRYMQVVATVKHPQKFPAITHADCTARVQTVPADDSGIRKLLEAWYAQTGCPMLLNTSLNIRGEPMVDTRYDADRFEKQYGVKVCS
jgi:carbamoyltransferase